MNKVFLVGNLTRDPENRRTQSGVSVTSFTIAVERSHAKEGEKRPVDFIPIVTWRNTADLCARYLSKGRQVAVVGEWHNRDYEKDGVKRTISECIADEVKFCGPPSREREESPFPDEDY